MTTNQHPNPIRDLFRFYWETYGGFDEVIRSFYLRAALVLGIVTAPGWISREWWDLPLSVLPNVLGFTIAGFAIFLSLGDDTFRRAITGKVDGEEAFRSVGIHYTIDASACFSGDRVSKVIDFATEEFELLHE